MDLVDFINLISIFLHLMGLFIIFANSLICFIKYIIYLFKNNYIDNVNSLRLQLGNSMIFGLDFIVGSDIIQSLVEFQYSSIIKLGMLVLIRILLSYFLIQELEKIS
ncbi:DUF1622 domain-containing protein [Candidatus Babela massiliensis]|uniref:DUF1622 domain-containing protein n=1 Tax=Candidatus Babela massiliensis TaxID=673862 RepID=V6DJK7_9BACT|nr:DUF1622 domain-containing protein [Candidatus Babela massiliensis]CDK30696.1 protein of unknown function DUF1622 [Candidatus Babela massiliensis]